MLERLRAAVVRTKTVRVLMDARARLLARADHHALFDVGGNIGAAWNRPRLAV